MNICIKYETVSGNTKMIADAILEECKTKTIVESIEEADLVFIGSWTDKGNFSQGMIELLRILKNKKVALFGTAGFGGSKQYYDSLLQRVCSVLDESNEVVQTFYCQGKMPMNVKDRYVKMIQEHPEDKKLEVSIKNFEDALSHPDRQDIDNAKLFAREAINKVENK